ncbi:DNA internalization-related competence protein ComEC/Rec2 [Exiguobacterium alkaliphilum]|uniref:DNA internalization-related competence protein ComEC/Rec2 n=1 Tax=Exiguobacterium alkaliphilum TaxID=1428684 RepID=UPI001BACFCB2|nr:DNA internalization-related competence protein ComEC/Rec2 [Exiguobacterium alkaliphilum]QUE87677.1 DNA internalization-related competence protein ComEC/Rec2 [Exiguobacterium alkaliphilum]
MPIFPLLPISVLIACTQGFVLVGFVLFLFLLATCRGQSVGTYIGAGCLALIIFWHDEPPVISGGEDVLFSIESRRDNGRSVRLYGETSGANGVLVGRDVALGRPGETCLVTFEPDAFAPLRNVGGFDEMAWATGAGLSFKGRQVTVHACRPTAGVDGAMLRFKERQLARIEATYRADVALYMEALLFGEGRLLDEETSFSYRVTGLLHLLVISGSHIAMLVLAFKWLLVPFPFHRETKMILIVLIVTAFGWLTGFSPPVARAVLVADMVLILSLFGYSVRDPMRLLSWCGAGLLALQPYLLFNLGFQLTVGMTLFLIVTRALWTNVLSLAIYAQWVGLILLWHVQPVISIAAPFYNVIVAILFSWVMIPLGFLAYLVPLYEPLLHPVLDGLHGTFTLHNQVKPWLPLHELTVWGSFLLAIGLWIGLLFLERRQLIGWGVALLTLSAVALASELKEEGRVTFLDVGQGDAIVVETHGLTGLIDVGGVYHDPSEKKRSTFDPGADVVAPYLWKRGEREIDFLLLTHADHDHIGGLDGLLDLIQVKEVWLAAEAADMEKRGELLSKLARKNVPVRFVRAGDRPYPWFWIVSPSERKADENANSVSAYLTVGGMTYLLTGDLPEAGEAALPTVDVDVFKLGHHGSDTSSSEALVNRIDPEWVVASVGRNNRYGHPHPDVLARLVGRRVLRTDEDGMIVCERDACRGIMETKVSR